MSELRPENWVDNYTDYLYSLAFLKTSSREEAEDLVQDTFLSAFRGREGFRGDSSEKTWLTSILKHKLVDYYRKKNAEQPLTDYIQATASSFQETVFDESNFGRFKTLIKPNYFSKSGEDFLLGEEFRKILDDCILKMPAKLRSVFMAKYIQDEESDHICKEHGITSSNYWVVIHRSKILLRACLEKQGFMGTT
ncbi:MAG: sigma-70 family RNA polymerase sigma factor [Saprospiraceae bacterium]|nr:sigma-70 family RNA polymerase sigma factor [Saprospiraceae bacterium]